MKELYSLCNSPSLAFRKKKSFFLFSLLAFVNESLPTCLAAFYLRQLLYSALLQPRAPASRLNKLRSSSASTLEQQADVASHVSARQKECHLSHVGARERVSYTVHTVACTRGNLAVCEYHLLVLLPSALRCQNQVESDTIRLA